MTHPPQGRPCPTFFKQIAQKCKTKKKNHYALATAGGNFCAHLGTAVPGVTGHCLSAGRFFRPVLRRRLPFFASGPLGSTISFSKHRRAGRRLVVACLERVLPSIFNVSLPGPGGPILPPLLHNFTADPFPQRKASTPPGGGAGGLRISPAAESTVARPAPAKPISRDLRVFEPWPPRRFWVGDRSEKELPGTRARATARLAEGRSPGKAAWRAKSFRTDRTSARPHSGKTGTARAIPPERPAVLKAGPPPTYHGAQLKGRRSTPVEDAYLPPAEKVWPPPAAGIVEDRSGP